MNNSRSPSESVNTIIATIKRQLRDDICSSCAIKLAARYLYMQPGRVEQVWIDYNVQQLDAETALD